MARLLHLFAFALCAATLTSAARNPVSKGAAVQHSFAAPQSNGSRPLQDHWTSLSHAGLSVNSPPGAQHHTPRYLCLSTLWQAELDPATALLHFGTVKKRKWDDVMNRCGSIGGIEGCEKEDLGSHDLERVRGSGECRAAKGTVDGRALFDPEKAGCEPLKELWRHLRMSKASKQADELLSFTAHLEIQHLPTSLRNGTHHDNFWLAHFHTQERAVWPLSNNLWFKEKGRQQLAMERDEGEEERWKGGKVPNKIAALMQDPYLPRATKPKSGDAMNGVDTTLSRWNLGVSLRLPPPPHANSSQSFLLPVHAPVAGQVLNSTLYRRPNAPSSVNDEQGWVISIRDEWSFVWHLFGISPYHQNVYPGQLIPKGYIIGHVSTKPLAYKRPLDQDPPADPPEKPPGGDGNPLYAYRYRELRVGVARPGRGWTTWRHPYEGGWTWYDPLRFLEDGEDHDGQQRPPPVFDPPTIFFSRASPYPPAPPTFIAASSTLSASDERPPTLSGDVEVMIGIKAFANPLYVGDGQDGRGGATKLDPLTVSKVEWGVRKVKGGIRNQAERAGDCGGLSEEDWRSAIDHERIPHRWPSASSLLEDGAQYDNVDPTWDLWNYVVPAFTTGNYAWTRKRWGSQWDWKARYLIYPLTRTLMTSNGPLSSSSAHSNIAPIAPHGSWNTRLEAPPVPRRGSATFASLTSRVDGQGPGEYILAVRAHDAWGGRACAKTRVWLQN